MSSQEDFTFPIVSDSFPSPIGSPPLWRLSGDDADQEDHDYFSPTSTKNSRRRRSMSSIESKTRKKMVEKSKSEGDEEEEKMDMLWEDFNEDLYMSSSASRSLSNDTNRRSIKNESSCYAEMAEFNGGCAHRYQTLKLSKTSSKAVISAGKPGVVVMVKFLKKLFLFHNNNRPAKRQPW